MAKVDEKPPTGRFGAILSTLGPKKVARAEIVIMLKGYGRDFESSGVEKKLNIPQELRKIEKENGSAFYVHPEVGNLDEVINRLRSGERAEPKGVEYAIAFVGGSSSIDVVIVDSARKLVIKRRIWALGSEAYDQVWTKIGNELESNKMAEKYKFLVEGK